MSDETPMSDDTRMKMAYIALGAIDSLHTNLDKMREMPKGSIGHLSDPTPVDHNIEQALISLEVASMRLQQVTKIVADRMGEKTS